MVERLLELRAESMLEAHRHRPAGYNEIIVDSAYSEANLPLSIEAIFYPLSPKCSERCESHARQVHARFVQEYGATGVDATTVPLLGLRPDHWERPFVVAPPKRPDEGGGGWQEAAVVKTYGRE